MKFSANLGFLWKELTLPDAIRAAAANGFSAVECHFPYTVSAQEVKTALDETGMTMIGLNTYPGNFAQGERGFCAIPGRENDARDVIEQAVAYAAEISCRNIHVMAGITSHKYARDTFIKNLVYACNKAQEKGIHIVIEPLNTRDTPGYFLTHTDQARQIINEVNRQNIKLMFDCYHVEIMEGDVIARLSDCLADIGHIQFASVPGRHEPDRGTLDYRGVFSFLADCGYQQPLGAEYVPLSTTEAGLGWMRTLIE